MIRVPYYQQLFEYTCGPATLRMILAFWGRPIGRMRAISLCKTTSAHGTTRRNLVQAARSQGLHVHAHSHGTLREIQALLDKKVPVIVNYREHLAEDGHYAVVIGLTKTHVIMNDPYHGPRLKIKRPEFLRRWRGKHDRTHHHWILAASRNRNVFAKH